MTTVRRYQRRDGTTVRQHQRDTGAGGPGERRPAAEGAALPRPVTAAPPSAEPVAEGGWWDDDEPRPEPWMAGDDGAEFYAALDAGDEEAMEHAARERRTEWAFQDMQAEMRRWRSLPEPAPPPREPMTPAKAKLLGLETEADRVKFDRLCAYRDAGYTGPLDSDNRIPDPDDPANREWLHAGAAMRANSADG